MPRRTKPDNEPRPAQSREPIAIVGIGCRLPGGASDPEAFWKLLREGVDAITEIPPDRWSIKAFYDPEPGTPGKTNARWGGFVEGIDKFDADFFGISPREAARMDPQQRLLLEVAWEALEDAGLPAEQLEGTSAGVFIGLSSTDYMLIAQSSGDLSKIDAHTNTGGAMSIAANRISYCLNLQGPSIALDTACSSSLVAVHEACQSIWGGECPVALAGGVNVLIKPEPYIGFSRLSMLSPDGRCKAFDASANGFVRSEGAAIVVLKPLSRARADADSIYAVIRGTACNQDGHTTGLTVPSEKAQEALVREACRAAGVEPAHIQFVEAHGPGTLVGDPIEARALGAVLAERRDQPCLLGSVKTNIGHLEPAAGIAGLIKVALALKHGEIPPNLHFQQPNPAIPFDELKLRVPTRLERWSRELGPVLAGVNSFGFGGTNAHVVLEEFVAAEDPRETTTPRAQLVTLSARSATALKAFAGACREFLSPEGAGAEVSLNDVCFSTSLRRSHHDHRLGLVAETKAELLEKLGAFAAGESRPGLVSGRVVAGQQPAIVYVCSGQGPQWWAMGRELMETEPAFRKIIRKCDRVVRELGDWSLWDELTAAESASRMHETSISQPAIFALQVALARLWESWGIRPDALVGHSVGEVAAAYLAGALGFEDAVRTIFHRGRCMDFAAAHGKMLAVGLPLEQARRLVDGREDKVALAAHNSPSSVSLSGDAETLEAIARDLDAGNVFNRFLKVQYAFHSPQMDPMRDELLRSLADVRPRRAGLPLYSTVTGGRVEGNELDADYWWRNVRQSVQFAGTVDAILGDGYTVFVELAPHPVLASSVTESALARQARVSVLHSLRRGEPERASVLQSLAALYTQGSPVDGSTVAPEGRFARLPRYPWQKEVHWSEAEESRQFRVGALAHPLLGKRLVAARPTWESKVDSRVVRYLNDHRVQGQVLLSGTTYLEMALAAARELYGPGNYVVEGVELHKALFLPADDAATLQLVVDPDESTFNIYSRPRENGQAWIGHVSGVVRAAPENGANGANGLVDLEAIRARCAAELSGEQCYEKMKLLGLDYGPTFRGIERLWTGDGEALGLVRVPESLCEGLDGYEVHPAVLDSCFQVLAGTLAGGGNGTNGGGGVYLPVEYEKIRIRGRATGQLWSHVRLVERNGKGVVADLDVLDETGHPVVEVRGFRCQSLDSTGDAGAARAARELVYEYRWLLKARADQLPTRRSAADLPGPARVVERTALEARRLAADLGLTDKYQRLEREIDALCTAFVLDAFRTLGAGLRVGERFTTDELSARMRIDGRYWRLMHRYLEMLAADGLLLEAAPGTWEVRETPDPGDPRERWQRLLACNPAFYAELTLLGRCAQQLAAILRGEVDPLQLIFPEGSLAIAEHLYQDSPSLRFYNTLVQRAVATLLETLPEGRTLRVLEIGAGTGGMTAYVLPKLPADRTQYLYTDLSNHFFLKAQEKFGDWPFVEYKRLDIENDPVEQGFEPQSFDLILASECLHATADMRRTMGHVGKLLASEGLLVLLEAVRPVRWVDLVFGLTDGWWRFTDTDLRPSYPLLTVAQWRTLLAEFGYGEVGEASGRPDEQIENAVIVARGRRLEPAAAVQERSDVPPAAGEPTSWLIYADRGGVGRELAHRLAARGSRTTLVFRGAGFRSLAEDEFEIAAESRDDVQWLLAELGQADRPRCGGIVHLWNLDAPSTESASIESLDAQMVSGCLSVVHLAHVLSDVDAAEAPRLWLVSRGAQSVGREIEPTAAPQAPLWGLGRVVINEVPKLRATLVDLDPSGDPRALESLCAELVLDGDEDEVALRGAARYVHRYMRSADHEDSADARMVVRSGSQAYRLEASRTGTLDRLTLRATKRRRLEPGQLEIQVAATGLNFADVMKALGLYPGLPDGPIPLGIECAGRITAVGPGVLGFAPGDHVVAIAPFAFGAFAVTGADFVAKLPPQLSFEEAATIPIAFLTAHYALEHLGRMQPGEKALIHAATGGVGLAAVQLCRRAGAEIFATAGTPEKRDFLHALGIEHVMDSRSLEFADEVREATGGRGVDLVLNSLAGEGIRKGLSCLADYGRFLEIGKRDIYANSRLGMRPFKKNLSFIAIDLDRAMRERPDVLSGLFQQIVHDVAAGELMPLPYRVFPLSNAAGAFRYMAKAKHIGKVVVSMHEPEAAIAPAAVGGLTLREDATYLMTGGLGGFGLTVAQWMVEHGARHLALMGRSGASTPEAEQAVQAMREAGAEVVVFRGDVTDPGETARVLGDIERTMPPLRGVLHAAMVLRDRLLGDLDRERMHEVWSPKVNGALNLHTMTLDKELDFFVLFSSLSSVFGIGGQANYASANAFLDSLSYWRRARGLPAVTVSWGFLGQVGWVARHEEIASRLESQGVRSFTPQQALFLLGRFLQEERPHVGVMNIDWKRWGEAAGSSRISPRFADLVRQGSDGGGEQRKGGAALRKALLEAGPEQRHEMMVGLLRDQVARVLGASPAKLDLDKPLTELGLDSLMAVELRNWIEGDLRLSLPTVELMKGPSVMRLADLMLTQLGRLDRGSRAPAVPEIRRAVEASRAEEPERLLVRVDEMPDEQVDALLKEMAAKGEETAG